MGATNSKILTPEQLAKLVERTHFGEKELVVWHRGFVREFPNGFLKLEEFTTMYKRYFPFGKVDAYTLLLFSSMDKDGDGRVGFDEFVQAMSVMNRGELKEKLEWSFRFYDRDKDGRISRQDMLAVVSAIYAMIGQSIATPSSVPPTGKELSSSTSSWTSHPNSPSPLAASRVDRLFELMDVDKDGWVGRDDFYQSVQSHPEMMKGLSLYTGL